MQIGTKVWFHAVCVHRNRHDASPLTVLMDWTANLSGGCLVRLGSCLKNDEFMVVI
jgi:hypothetical protein